MAALALTMVVFTACDPGDPGGDRSGPARVSDPLVNGEGSEMFGVIDLVGREPSGTKTRCSGVLINTHTILTSARCVQNFVPAGHRWVKPRETAAFEAYKLGWSAERGYYKQCIVSASPAADGTCTHPKPKAIFVHGTHPPVNADSDLAILYSDAYNFKQTSEQDYRDIYMGNLEPGTVDLEVHGYGRNDTGSTTGLPRTGAMPLVGVSGSSLALAGGPTRLCTGDRGGPWVGPSWNMFIRHTAIGLHARNDASDTNGCTAVTQPPTVTRATRLRDKVGWIESIAGRCADNFDNPYPTKRCDTLEPTTCDGYLEDSDPAYFAGCRGTGCTVCAELVDKYPRYFTNHPTCASTTTCNGQYFPCSLNCPAPTAADAGLWGAGLSGAYYKNTKDITDTRPPTDLYAQAFAQRWDPKVDFLWTGQPIAGLGWGCTAGTVVHGLTCSGSDRLGLGVDNFAVRWEGLIKTDTAGQYTFQTRSNDGVRLWLNGSLEINNWTNHAATNNNTRTLSLSAGAVLRVKLEYYDATGEAEIRLRWRKPGTTSFVAIPASNLSPP
jgi:hypothetical protein